MTIREIANLTNLSFSTVYRTLKNPDKAKPIYLQKIDQVLKEPPNLLNLKQVYIMIPFINEFYTLFVLYISNLLSNKGIMVIPFIYNEDVLIVKKYLNSLPLSPRIGLIWIPIGGKNDYPFLSRKKNKVPMVSLLRELSDFSPDIQIFQDNKQAIDISIDYLISRNRSKILLVNGSTLLTTSKERKECFLENIQRNTAICGDIIEAEFQEWKSAYNAIKNSIDIDSYDAIITTSEHLAYGVVKILDELNINRKNKDIICFDYTPALESLGLTMIYFSPQQLAERTVTALFEKISNPDYLARYIITPIVNFNN